jgi:hypothetical protein
MKVSIASLIYKSPVYADFVYEQVHKYTPEIQTGEAEFYFVANDASPEVLEHLRRKGYPFYEQTNHKYTNDELFSLGYGKPEYIHRVYKGWNRAIDEAKGEYVVLINSDNAFSPNWLYNLVRRTDKNTIVSSLLVERGHEVIGTFPANLNGTGSIEYNCGKTPYSYDEEKFQAFVQKVSKDAISFGGVYMPFCFLKEGAVRYPEGNIAGSNFDDVIDYGDRVFMRNMNRRHITAWDSVAYHFQQGEMEFSTGTIYLVAECKSGLGEDTFWTWFEREFKNTKFINRPEQPPEFDGSKDCMLVYSTMGPVSFKGKVFSLCWELYPEMREMLHSNEWDAKIETTKASARSASHVIVATPFAKQYYEECGVPVTLLPLGLDTDLFSPKDKAAMRLKHAIPSDAKVGYWGGTCHVMKGLDRLIQYASDHPDIFWIIVWKQQGDRGTFPSENSAQYVHVPQAMIAELMSCSDFFLCTSRLRPYYMTELEAMSCNLPFVFTETIEKDFVPSDQPRDDIFKHGWDRACVKRRWIELLS